MGAKLSELPAGIASNSTLSSLVEAAYACGDMLRMAFREGVHSHLKSDRSDITALDEKSERLAVEIIKTRLGDIDIVSEELFPGFHPGQYPNGFVTIDGIDGTTNFARRVPVANFTCSFIKPQGGRLETYAGVVYDFINDELFCALLGHGAFKNGSPIRVDNTRTLSESVISFAPLLHRRQSGGDEERTSVDAVWATMRRTSERSGRFYREFQSGALELAWLADGSRLDAYAASWTSPWDLSAGVLIVREAGGVVTDLHGGVWEPSYRGLVAGSPAIHSELLNDMRLAFADQRGAG